MTLEEVRINIDRVDRQIKDLFRERMELADQVAQVKAETGDTILKPDREVAIIERLTADVKDDIKKEYIALLRRIMEVSRKYQYGRMLELRDCLNVSWVEEEPSIGRLAMIKPELYLCSALSRDLVQTVDTCEEVGRLIAEGKADAGMGVLENVGIDVSHEMHSMLVNQKLYINRCDLVEEKEIRKKLVLFSPSLVVRPEHNRTKFMFVCPNRSGSISSILSMISDYHVNLTEIHSRPNREAQWNYEFFVEIEANFLKKEIQALIFQLQNETQYFQILGSYFCTGDL